MKNRRRAATFASSLFAAAVRRISYIVQIAAPAAAFFVIAASMFTWGWWSAHAAVVTTTITGTITGPSAIAGSTTDGISRSTFGLAPATSLSGQSFTLVYTTNDALGNSTSSPPTSSSIVSTATSNPITAVMTINGVSVNLGNCGYCTVNGTSINSTANDATLYGLGETHVFGTDYGGSGGADANVYFSNPPYWNKADYGSEKEQQHSLPPTGQHDCLSRRKRSSLPRFAMHEIFTHTPC